MASRKRREDETQEEYRANLKTEAAEEKGKVHNGKMRRGFTVHNKATPYKKHVKEKTTPAHHVFKYLIDILRADNGGGSSTIYYEDYKRAEPAINKLMELGYFKDNPSDLKSSFWIMSAGETTEREEYFDKDLESYTIISDVLETIFNRVDNPEDGR